MSEHLELAIDKINEVADSHPEDYYHHMVFSLTADAQHTAENISSADFATLVKFVEDVKILQKWDKEK